MPKAPEVMSGMRNPRSERLEKIREDTEAAYTAPSNVAQGEQETVYVSRVRRYRVQITCAPDIIDPFTGQRQIGRNLAIVFEDGVYRNREDRLHPERRALIDRTLQSNPYFGKFGQAGADFWLASEQNDAVQANKLKAAAATLKSLPKEVLEDFLAAALTPSDATDHKLPAPPTP